MGLDGTRSRWLPQILAGYAAQGQEASVPGLERLPERLSAHMTRLPQSKRAGKEHVGRCHAYMPALETPRGQFWDVLLVTQFS